jgi:hypothetical protein
MATLALGAGDCDDAPAQSLSRSSVVVIVGSLSFAVPASLDVFTCLISRNHRN